MRLPERSLLWEGAATVLASGISSGYGQEAAHDDGGEALTTLRCALRPTEDTDGEDSASTD